MYDTLNRLTTFQAGTANHVYTYTSVNPLVQSLTRPNGSVTTYQYNGLNQLTEILNKTSTDDMLNQHVFTYNNQDLRSSETISGSALPAMPSLPDETVDYAYNTVNQLLSVTNPNLTFVYDADGNMIQGYVNPLLGGAEVGFPFTVTYDAEDRMTSLEYTDSSSVVHRMEYSYSGDGFLAIIRKFENSSLVNEIRIVRDGFLAIQDRDGSNTVLREYTWGLNLGGGIGGLLNLKQGGQDYSYLYDGKGNVAAVIDASQAVVAAYRYAPFGKLLAKTGSLDQPFGFSTKRYDAQTGLIHYQYRSYAPEIGRWTTRDPLGEAGGMNLYAFVGNNPVNWVDPFGLFVDIWFNRSTGIVVAIDRDTQQRIEISAESGGKPSGDPIPLGNWEILDQARNPESFRLDAIDENRRNDIHDPTGRKYFRLHEPGNTLGCIAATDREQWNRLRDMINNTKTISVQDNTIPWWKFWVSDQIKKYGRLRVVK